MVSLGEVTTLVLVTTSVSHEVVVRFTTGVIVAVTVAVGVN